MPESFPYRLIERLGRGAMAEVWRAEDLRDGRRVAVKLLPERLASNSGFRARFQELDRAFAIARGIAAGVAAAHSRGVIHRDLKPSNVLVDREGRPRITDFGAAVASGEPQHPGDSLGTPGYIAPERLSGAPATVETDLYSLVVVLYELFSGTSAAVVGGDPGIG
jgi:serine/threonine protein kinase